MCSRQTGQSLACTELASYGIVEVSVEDKLCGERSREQIRGAT